MVSEIGLFRGVVVVCAPADELPRRKDKLRQLSVPIGKIDKIA
jgi:hypothetical protein